MGTVVLRLKFPQQIASFGKQKLTITAKMIVARLLHLRRWAGGRLLYGNAQSRVGGE
jgi:hypothetical protein